MEYYDSVAPDKPLITKLPASTFFYVQTVFPFFFFALSLLLYLILLLRANHYDVASIHHGLAAVMMLLLISSFLRRVTPYLFIEKGHHQYHRVTTIITRQLPNTRQSWIALQTLAVVAVVVPLCLYLFTHAIADGDLYAFAWFGHPGIPGGPLFFLFVTVLLSASVAGLQYVLVQLPLYGLNRLYVQAPQDRMRLWIRRSAWLPPTCLLLFLFSLPWLLLCGGAPADSDSAAPPYACGSGAHWIGSLLAWLALAVSFVCLDAGVDVVRLLGGQPVSYYALEPRMDGLFCELLVWVLKVAAIVPAALPPVAAHVIVICACLLLLLAACLLHTATAEVLEELVRYPMALVALTSITSCLLRIGVVPEIVQGLLTLLIWLLAVGGAAALYHRRFGWTIMGSGREITADLIIL